MNGIKKIIVGPIDDKNLVLLKSKFTFCIENNGNSRGYLTEKFFDAIKSGSIPVYLGAIDIQKLVPDNIYINIRKFNDNFDDLMAFLLKMKGAEGKCYQKNGYEFLTNGSDIDKYLPKNIAKQIINAIND